jgi:hypothetical protein
MELVGASCSLEGLIRETCKQFLNWYKLIIGLDMTVFNLTLSFVFIWGSNQKFPDWVDNEMYAYNNKHSLRSNTKGYGGKTH